MVWMRVYQNRHILSFKFLKLNLSTKGSTVFIKIVDCFSKRVDPSVKRGWPFRQKRLTFSSKRVNLFVKKGWPFRQKGLTFPSKRVNLLVNKEDMSILTHARSLLSVCNALDTSSNILFCPKQFVFVHIKTVNASHKLTWSCICSYIKLIASF